MSCKSGDQICRDLYRIDFIEFHSRSMQIRERNTTQLLTNLNKAMHGGNNK
jgi:hypothetical protein